MIDPRRVTASLVTRGDVDMTPVVQSIRQVGVRDVVVWDNSTRASDLAVYGRYAAMYEGEHQVVYVQDDDCLVDVAAVLAAYESGRLVANMPRSRWPDYPDSTLVGWGAVFDRRLWSAALARCMTLAVTEVAEPGFLHRTCDVLFSALTPRTVIDVGFRHREFAETEGRMFRQPGHKAERDRMLAMCRAIRGDDDDRRIS